MNVPTEIIGVFVAFMLAELAATIGFFWKYNQSYNNDQKALQTFLSNLKDEFISKFSTIETQRLNDVNINSLRCSERESKFNERATKIENDMQREREMGKRDVDDLKVQIETVTEKMDEMQESISTIHRRIDELFKMIQKNNTANKSTARPTATKASK